MLLSDPNNHAIFSFVDKIYTKKDLRIIQLLYITVSLTLRRQNYENKIPFLNKPA